MIPAFLITLREVLEASLIVATIAGILVRLGKRALVRTVIVASICAMIGSMCLIGFLTLIGYQAQTLYTGAFEELIEGSLMLISAGFITWAVFFLHTHFAQYKTRLLSHLKETVEISPDQGLFVLVFTAVFREGIEIVLFLATIYFSESPGMIALGSSLGLFVGLTVAFGLVHATIRLPVYWAFRLSSILLIVFAAGLVGRGLHEFGELGLIPTFGTLSIGFLPQQTTVAGQMIHALFGVSRSMDGISCILYTAYIATMYWWVYGRSTGVLANARADK